MRTGLTRGRLWRLVHLSRDAIAGAVDVLRRRALLPLVSVREKLGLAAVPGVGGRGEDLAGTGAPGRPAAGARARAADTRDGEGASAREANASERPRAGRGAEASREGGGRSAPEAPAELPRERREAVPGPRLPGAEAAAELHHVALVVPPKPGTSPRGKPAPVPAAEPADIPWSYGKDRVTAAAIDPDRLYAYWEVTDEAIARARAVLGSAGDDAWLNLRVYDTTGLLFDGTNAHHHFDHGIGRSERQWFFHIGRPTSAVFVEIGLRARDGGFARMARSARVDFPRSEPAPWTDPEWMTVVASTGETQLAGRGVRSPAMPAAAPAPAAPSRAAGLAAAPESFLPIPLWVIRDAAGHATWARELTHSAWERVEWSEAGGERWLELVGHVEWEGPRTFSTWEAGPFTYPVEVREPTRQEWEGQSVAYRVGGVTRVVHGPWQVVIKNLGAHVSRTVLGRWQIYRSWVAEAGREVRPAAASRTTPVGASEALAGGSERAWAMGSELRLGGASEVWRLGASELRLGGASESLYMGASERRVRGASEQRLGGASEWLVQGASERRLGGASEWPAPGASEQRLGGASERRLGGASEGRPGGAEAQAAYPKRSG